MIGGSIARTGEGLVLGTLGRAVSGAGSLELHAGGGLCEVRRSLSASLGLKFQFERNAAAEAVGAFSIAAVWRRAV